MPKRTDIETVLGSCYVVDGITRRTFVAGELV
ncbi:hypothetical protein GGP85_003169 [Salinibacter ruber]|nr:hypothetical protein [Salinibacter ruber]MCS3827699.1 hypothetical protein [Salinibacter ruber]MCS4146320.1 hypothetical protein [Salinibacter ruber]